MFIIFIIVVVFALIIVGLVNGYRWWKELKLPRFLFFIVVILLIAHMVFTMRQTRIVSNQILKNASLLLSAVFFIVMIYGSLIFTVKSLILVIAKKIKKDDNKFIKFLSSRKKITPIILAFTIIIGIAGYVNMGIIRETEYDIVIDKPSANENITFAVISDAHIGIAVNPNTLDIIVKKINDMNVDAVFMVGDIIDESTSYSDIQYMVDVFSKLESTYGTYYVQGNHELYIGEDTTHYFREAGINVLLDETAIIGDDITVIGKRDEYDSGKTIDEIIADEKIDFSKPVILLNHEPLRLMEYAQAGIDLSFSGHTHGEQFPLTQRLFLLANDMMYGEEKIEKMTAITTSGVGGWGFHYKLPAKSEIVKVKMTFQD